MKNYFILIVALIIGNSVFAQGIEEKPGFKNLNISPDGKNLIFSHDENRGFYLLDINTNKISQIENNKFSVYMASFSKDGKYIAYKRFIETEKMRLQQPVLFEIQSRKTIELFEPVPRCGTPSFSDNGNVVFTIGKILYLTNFKGEELKTLRLPSYSNLTPVSPNGIYVVFNDNKDRLWKINLQTEEKQLLDKKNNGYFEPHWSPDGQKIVASSMSGELNIFNINNTSVIQIGTGKHPIWTNDSKKIIYSKANVLEAREVLSQELYVFDTENNSDIKLTNSDEREDYPALIGNKVYFSSTNSGSLFLAEMSDEKDAIEIFNKTKVDIRLNSEPVSPKIQINKKKDPLSAVYFDIPYVNQRYDTPDWFNGNSACGATAAIQCISYFGLVKQWPVWVSTPFPHISDYGNYICEIYSYNGTTFNIGGRDPNGTIGYGGYGYIIKNNWANTKDYMRDYARIHSLGSTVDWNENREKLAIEITNEDPFVLLNSLTTSGHYISVIGYDNIDTTTVIVNDPYGNKNLGYANFYGRRAWYDWPGYNNGYENLNTVHCFIYFRGDPPADLAVQSFTVNADTGALGQKLFVTTEISNIGKMSSTATTAEFYLSESGVYDENAFVLDNYSIPALQIGQTHSIQDSISLPDSLISDSYKLCVFADADTINNEILKDNNVMSRDFVIYGYPRLYSIVPIEGSVITNLRPQIRVKYQDFVTAINPDSVKLYLDNIEITDSAVVQLRRIDYYPGNDLAAGIHDLCVKVPSTIGLTTVYNWSFEIQQVSGIDEQIINPNDFYLSQNFPNPFNPKTKIAFNLPNAENITLKIFDISGNLVTEIVKNEFYSAGYHKLSLNGVTLASGVYFYRLNSGNKSLTKKMLLLR